MTVEVNKKQVLERAEHVIAEAKVTVERAMRPALTPKNYAKIGAVFACIGSTEFVQNAFMLEKNKAYTGGLNDIMRKFLVERWVVFVLVLKYMLYLFILIFELICFDFRFVEFTPRIKNKHTLNTIYTYIQRIVMNNITTTKRSDLRRLLSTDL